MVGLFYRKCPVKIQHPMHFRLSGVIFAMREGCLSRKRGCEVESYVYICLYVCICFCRCVDLRQKKECGSGRRGCGVEYVIMYIFVCVWWCINLRRAGSVGVEGKTVACLVYTYVYVYIYLYVCIWF